ncbi:NaeI family type II restriction endonuclease [Nocardia sp. NPDC059180]|uniref:NaeI family type II restriction endonuclease n=1 Tax=Nocardia sp. NPDC059180 TaxID=3346761 RepID=UPI0036840CE5
MTESLQLFPPDPRPIEQPSEADVGLQYVWDWFKAQRAMEARFGIALRQSIDEVLDGQRTGRYDINTLEKTEKTYLGTKVEIVVRAEFELERGASKEMDYKIDGYAVDSKFSLKGQWTIPREAIGHICLVMAADDHKGTFDVGLVRINPTILNSGRNQDGKATISRDGRENIKWLCQKAELPRNLLLALHGQNSFNVDAIMAKKSGQQRINELMRRVQGTIIDRNTAVTVARQHDGMKRCRDARNHLRGDGIVLLGHQNEGPKIASQLGLPRIEKGTYIAVRLAEVAAPTQERPAALIEGRYYAIAKPDDPHQPAPTIRM